MIVEHYLLLILAILPLFYKYAFWFYTIQLKDYRWDRFKEYLFTPQWNSALVNIWTVIELPLLLVSFIVFINSPFEIIIYNVLFVFLLIQNLFVIRKIFSKRILAPKITWRLLLTLLVLLLWFYWDLYYIITRELWNHIYSYILSIYLFAPIVIFFVILITLPLVNLLKYFKIKKAISISKKYNKPIKIWITWSYGKSSIKDYLASILIQDWTTLKTPDNINSELWVAGIVSKYLNNNFKYFVAEMWAYKIGEIDLLWKIVNHKYWFLTWIWNQHLWLFGSLKNIKKGKSEIMKSVLKNKWIMYVNWNNKEISELSYNKELKLVKYWNCKWSDTKFKITWVKNWKTEFKFEYKWKEIKLNVWLIWIHNIINLTWVLAFCYDIWLKTNEIKKYIKNVESPKNTLSLIKSKKYTLIDDTYNLSEEWLLAGLDVLHSYEWEKILILDDILELGKKSRKIHYKLWKKIAKSKLSDKILYIWVNYKPDFLNWLFDGWYNTTSIINNISEIDKKSVILFEWRGTRKYINNFTTSV